MTDPPSPRPSAAPKSLLPSSGPSLTKLVGVWTGGFVHSPTWRETGRLEPLASVAINTALVRRERTWITEGAAVKKFVTPCYQVAGLVNFALQVLNLQDKNHNYGNAVDLPGYFK